jgi:hypothetical protein
MSELWHGEKLLKEVPRGLLCPHFIRGTSNFYVDELAKLNNGHFVIPVRWIIVDNQLVAECWKTARVHTTGLFDVQDAQLVDVPAQEFRQDYMQLLHHNNCPTLSDDAKGRLAELHRSTMPNHLRAIAGDKLLLTSWVNVWTDDVSGNQSKAWNVHNNVYVSHANLPRQTLSHEYHIHFISTSQHAGPVEQVAATHEMIQ